MAGKMKEWLKQGRLVRVFALGQLCQPKLIEVLGAHGGWDAVWLDQEHGGLSQQQLEDGLRAARAAGLETFVRLAPTDYATVMRALEAGAGGVMAAQVRGVRQAEDVVRWAKFAPRGERGFNSSGYDGAFGTAPFQEYMRRANADTFVAIQIEHSNAATEAEQIAGLADVDLLFIGPADLSQSLGVPGEWEHARVWEAIERVAAGCRKQGKQWGILPPNPAYARRCVDLGCRVLSLGLDVWVVHKGLQAFQGDYGEFFAQG